MARKTTATRKYIKTMFLDPNTTKLMDLVLLLEKARVRFREWEGHGRKSLKDLFRSFKDGYDQILFNPAGPKIERHTTSLALTICVLDGHEPIQLHESSRVVAGVTKPCFRHSICEKMKLGDCVQEAVARCLKKKLLKNNRAGFPGPVQLIRTKKGETPLQAIERGRLASRDADLSFMVETGFFSYEDPDPPSYPSLTTLRDFLTMLLIIPPDMRNSVSLERRHGDRVITYSWTEVDKQRHEAMFLAHVL